MLQLSDEFDAQMEALAAEKKHALDSERYEVKGPRAEQTRSLAIWKQCINNCESQLAHAMNAVKNLQCMKQYAHLQWQTHVKNMHSLKEYYTRVLLHDTHQRTQQINTARKREQLMCKHELQRLQHEWWTQVHANNHIQLECQILKQQLQRLNAPTRFV